MFKSARGGGGLGGPVEDQKDLLYFLCFRKLSITTNQIRFNKVCDKNTHPWTWSTIQTNHGEIVLDKEARHEAGT